MAQGNFVVCHMACKEQSQDPSSGLLTVYVEGRTRSCHLSLFSLSCPDAYFNFFFYYSINFITFVVVQSSQPNFITFPTQTLRASLHPPQPVSFGNHKFLKVCELVSVLEVHCVLFLDSICQ